MIGYAFCGSFCTLSESFKQMEVLISLGHQIQPIMSETAYTTDTRFGSGESWRQLVTSRCGRDIIHTISSAEPLGPKQPLEMLVLAPCTGNTLAKLATGITDSAVCMAVKAHLRTDRPLVIALASNDAMAANLKNIGALLTRRNVFFVPLFQDDPIGKPHSLVADFAQLPQAVAHAFRGEQLRPLFLSK